MPTDSHTVTPGHLGIGLNEFGSEIAVFVCDVCGQVFTVCPPPTVEQFGESCLSLDCDSYDVERDADLMFEIEPHRIHRNEGDRDGTT